MTDESASMSSDLLDLSLRFQSSINEFKPLLGEYNSQSPAMIKTVVERLRPVTDPDLHHSADFVAAAEELGPVLRNFDNLKIELMSTVGWVGFAVTTLVYSLEARYLPSLGKINAGTQYLQDLKDVNERVSKSLTAIAKLAGSLAIDAFDAAADILNLRLLFINKLLDETRPPEQVDGAHGESYTIVPIRDATVTEAIFIAGEEALKRLPVELAGQIPIISAGTAILKIAYDVREKLKLHKELRALWQQIINAPSQRNLAEMAYDGLRTIRGHDKVKGDDDNLRDLIKLLSELTDQLVIFTRNLPDTL